jgi:hypothetical protein
MSGVKKLRSPVMERRAARPLEVVDGNELLQEARGDLFRIKLPGSGRFYYNCSTIELLGPIRDAYERQARRPEN